MLRGEVKDFFKKSARLNNMTIIIAPRVSVAQLEGMIVV